MKMHLCLTVACITSGLHWSVCFYSVSPPPPARSDSNVTSSYESQGTVQNRRKGLGA